MEPEQKLKLVDAETAERESDIVIVDDDLSYRTMLKEYLFSHGDLKADMFTNGNDFIKHYKAKDKRIIILDYYFNENSNGLGILLQIKRMNPSAVVIMVSSQDNIEIAVETLRKGAADYFLKTNKTVFVNILSSLKKILEMDKHRMN